MVDLMLKEQFDYEVQLVYEDGGPKIVVVAVKLPSGAIEIITNTDDLEGKLKYYKVAYDDEFRLKANPAVQIVNFMIV
ncbi:hypothetical protein KP806_07635 [Paenibacillus sp. N4]|nr:hypothetical protein [Paenibacillus vietnamensis]